MVRDRARRPGGAADQDPHARRCGPTELRVNAKAGAGAVRGPCLVFATCGAQRDLRSPVARRQPARSTAFPRKQGAQRRDPQSSKAGLRPVCGPDLRCAESASLGPARNRTVTRSVLGVSTCLLSAQKRKRRPSRAATRCSSERQRRSPQARPINQCCRILTAIRQSRIGRAALLDLVHSGSHGRLEPGACLLGEATARWLAGRRLRG
jgi:hypothetical protein